MKTRASLAVLGLATLSLTACGGGSSNDDASKASAPTVAASSSTSSSSSASAQTSSATSKPVVTKTVTKAAPAPAQSKAKSNSSGGGGGGATIPAPSQEQVYDLASQDPTKDCSSPGTQIKTNAAASCPFAVKVEQVWAAKRANNTSLGEGDIYVKSPTTGDTYGLACSAGAHGSFCGTSRGAYIWMGGI